jgi:soluble lytic murein transglycosylase-like protein
MRTIFSLLLGLSLAGCRQENSTPPGSADFAASSVPTHAEIFGVIEVQAARYRMEPGFVYALVAAESNFDPRARNGEARGLMQLKPAAWRTVSSVPYEPTVWDWRANLEVGIDYLAHSRAYLHQKKVFSYPLLLAAFHYGLDHVADRDFDLSRLKIPDNEIYRELWAGNLAPLPRPGAPAANEAGSRATKSPR